MALADQPESARPQPSKPSGAQSAEAPVAHQSQSTGRVIPGLLAAASVAGIAGTLAMLVNPFVPISAMVLALVIGILLQGPLSLPLLQPGLTFCVKVLLRWAVALLGLRIALGDILALGFGVALLVVAAMVATLVSGLLVSRALGRHDGLGILAGAATAVCGASATLATSTVVPNYPGKATDIAFVVVAVNALSTVAMLAYPPFASALGFEDQTIGLLLGASIHDVAQVVGAGYSLSEAAGNTAVVVKLFRVLLLLPTVLVVGWYFASQAGEGAAEVSVPGFALAFLGLCVLNSLLHQVPCGREIFDPVRGVLLRGADWGLLIAIAALGIGTSVRAVAGVGWRHLVIILSTTLVILAVVTFGLLVFVPGAALP